MVVCGDSLKVRFTDPALAVSPGQAVVVYDDRGDEVLASAVIDSHSNDTFSQCFGFYNHFPHIDGRIIVVVGISRILRYISHIHIKSW